jgi:hypothetical protein
MQFKMMFPDRLSLIGTVMALAELTLIAKAMMASTTPNRLNI